MKSIKMVNLNKIKLIFKIAIIMIGVKSVSLLKINTDYKEL